LNWFSLCNRVFVEFEAEKRFLMLVASPSFTVLLPFLSRLIYDDDCLFQYLLLDVPASSATYNLQHILFPCCLYHGLCVFVFCVLCRYQKRRKHEERIFGKRTTTRTEHEEEVEEVEEVEEEKRC